MMANFSQRVSAQAREPAAALRITPQTKYTVIGIILAVALIAFEIFNFDTTKYALTNLFGSVTFLGVGWATILAIAFCGIDFAGLLRVFSADYDENDTPREVWYLMGAWLLGATMNALMTWYAVSLTLLQNDIGNQVLSQQQLLAVVPIFVAFLVWLTRILFIGSLSLAGSRLLAQPAERPVERVQPSAVREQARMRPAPVKRRPVVAEKEQPATEDETIFMRVPQATRPQNGVSAD